MSNLNVNKKQQITHHKVINNNVNNIGTSTTSRNINMNSGRVGLISSIIKQSQTFGMLSKIYETEGIKSLYRGLPPSLLSTCVSMSMFFPFYEKCRDYLSIQYNIEKQNPLVIAPSGKFFSFSFHFFSILTVVTFLFIFDLFI
jgi:hypothetical protein